jgi:hypothetical protein
VSLERLNLHSICTGLKEGVETQSFWYCTNWFDSDCCDIHSLHMKSVEGHVQTCKASVCKYCVCVWVQYIQVSEVLMFGPCSKHIWIDGD